MRVHRKVDDRYYQNVASTEPNDRLHHSILFVRISSVVHHAHIESTIKTMNEQHNSNYINKKTNDQVVPYISCGTCTYAWWSLLLLLLLLLLTLWKDHRYSSLFKLIECFVSIIQKTLLFACTPKRRNRFERYTEKRSEEHSRKTKNLNTNFDWSWKYFK